MDGMVKIVIGIMDIILQCVKKENENGEDTTSSRSK